MATIDTNDDATQKPGMLFEASYNTIQPELEALSPAELVPINIDILTAVTKVLGVQPKVMALSDQIAELPHSNGARPEKLDVYALALAHAHTLHSMASAPTSAIIPVSEEGTALRAALLSDATALDQRGLLDGNQLKHLRGPVGHKNLAFDLQILALAFRNSAKTIQGKCATTPTDVQHARELSLQLLTLVGIQERGPAVVAATADNRVRAFTLFVKAYDQVRRAVSYLRWEQGDLEDIAPSLYGGRASRRKKVDTPAPMPSPLPADPDSAVPA